MKENAAQSQYFQDFILVLAALVACWQVVTRGFGASFAESWPEIAVRLNGADAVALASLADTRRERAGKAANNENSGAAEEIGTSPEQIREWAGRAIRNDPLNARAIYVLGRLALENDDMIRASALMAAAMRRSMHETRAVYWLLGQSYGREDFSSALHYADVLLRTHPEFTREITPALARMSEHKAGNGGVTKLLAENPPWRPGFFRHLNGVIADARTPLDLFVSLKGKGAPPTAGELHGYLNFLVQKRFYDLAYYVWLQFLPSEQLKGVGPLFNGGFEHAPSGAPFDWVISPGVGVTIDIVTRPEQTDKRALRIEFGYGRVGFRPVRQLTVLAPGPHRFKGEYRGRLIGRRGLEWSVTCAGGKPIVIGHSPMAIGVVRNWTPFEFSFTVPGEGCRAQYVSLALAARSASERLVSGSMWYGGLEVASAKEGAEAAR
jgi:hypothetical protein